MKRRSKSLYMQRDQREWNRQRPIEIPQQRTHAFAFHRHTSSISYRNCFWERPIHKSLASLRIILPIYRCQPLPTSMENRTEPEWTFIQRQRTQLNPYSQIQIRKTGESEVKFVSTPTLILTLNDPHDAYPDPNRTSRRVKRKLSLNRIWT